MKTEMDMRHKLAKRLGYKQVGNRWHSKACQQDRENCGGEFPSDSELLWAAFEALIRLTSEDSK